MNRNEFFHAIKNDFFNDLTANFNDFKIMINNTLPVFGKLETKIEENSEGGKTIHFIDFDTADLIIASEGVNKEDVDVDMTTIMMTLHLNNKNVIEAVEHNFRIFTTTNKNLVLLFASLIGKSIVFE